MVIRKIGVGSAAKVAGALYAVLGLIGGCIIAMVSLVSSGFMREAAGGDMPSWIGPLFGVGAIVIAPIFYGLMGLILGAIVAVVYNLIAGMTGGLQIDVE